MSIQQEPLSQRYVLIVQEHDRVITTTIEWKSQNSARQLKFIVLLNEFWLFYIKLYAVKHSFRLIIIYNYYNNCNSKASYATLFCS